MADYSASCDGVQVDPDGGLYALAVYSDGEGFNSFVYHLTDVASRIAPNRQNELLDVRIWLTDIHRDRNGNLFCSDENGSVHRFQEGAWTTDPASPRALTCVWSLPSGTLLSGGDEGVIYFNDGSGWRPVSPALGDTVFSIRGTSESDLYACGAGGLFWRFDGAAWTRIPLPTNERLLGILAVSPDEVYVCGRGGVLFRGSGEAWEDFSFSGHNFHGIEIFDGRVYLAGAEEGIFRLDGADLLNIKDNITSYKLAGNGRYLASSGDNLAARFDGEGWFGSRFS
jgi:hypothetical protein